MVCNLMLLWQHARLQSPEPSKWNVTICDSTRQNTWSYLRHMQVPPSLGLLLNICKCIFCPVQLQMVIFYFKEEGTGTEHVAKATSKCIPFGTFLRVQHSSQVSIGHYRNVSGLGKSMVVFPFVWKTKIFKWKINYILES